MYSKSSSKNISCEFYNPALCKESPKGPGCGDIEYCPVAEYGKKSHCFVLWKVNGTEESVELKVGFYLCYTYNFDKFNFIRNLECKIHIW